MTRKIFTRWSLNDNGISLLAVAAHCILVVIIFPGAFLHPADFMFANGYDGIKNYFTLLSYVNQPDSIPLLQYQGMHYPFGDLIFFTDNAPLLAILMRLMKPPFADGMGPIVLFNLFLLANIVLSGYLLAKILKRFTTQRWLILMMSIILPWIQPQLFKLTEGHFNLSLSWVMLLAIFLLIRIREEVLSEGRDHKWYVAGIIALTLLAAWIHLYYLPILLLFTFVFLMWSALQYRKYQWPFAWSGLLCLIVPGMIMFLTIHSLDPHSGTRVVNPDYGADVWKFHLDALYSAPDFVKIPFPVRANYEIPNDSKGYMGGFALYGAVLFLLVFIFQHNRRQRIRRTFCSRENGRLVLAFMVAGFFCLTTSMGEYARIFNRSISFDNWLSPFYFLSMITDEVRQFRVVARFSWPVFWTWHFLIIYLFSNDLRTRWPNWKAQLTGIGLVTLLCADCVSYLGFYAKQHVTNPFHDADRTRPMELLLQDIRTEDYQAILPIPFYHVGSEDLEVTIDPVDRWSTDTYLMQNLTGLPLMSSKMSRTPIPEYHALLSIFRKGPLSPPLQSALNTRPLLVFVNTSKESYPSAKTNAIAQILESNKKFVDTHRLELLSETGDYALFRWETGLLR